METLISVIIKSWFWFAIVMSLFWGIRATSLFDNKQNLNKLGRFFWRAYQFIFNFVGSWAGWCCFYVLLIRAQNNLPNFQSLTLGDIILFIFSLLGLTGHLPEVTYGFVRGFAEIGNKAIDKILR